MEGRRSMKRVVRIILLPAVVVLLIFVCVRWKTGSPDEDGGYSDLEQTASECSASGTDAGEIFRGVLLGNGQFLCVSGGGMEAKAVAEVPSLFDAEDSFMKIWEFSAVDLDGDGEEEVVLFVVGAAGDMGGKVVLHQAGGKVYGYLTDNRILVDLKTDGTYRFSDSAGMSIEEGIAVFADFSEDGCTVDKISYAAGTQEGWLAFVAEHQPATEEEYLDAVSRQERKQSAEWFAFTEEAINALF